MSASLKRSLFTALASDQAALVKLPKHWLQHGGTQARLQVSTSLNLGYCNLLDIDDYQSMAPTYHRHLPVTQNLPEAVHAWQWTHFGGCSLA